MIDIIGASCLTFSNVYIWFNLLNKKINFKNLKLYLGMIALVLISIINYNNISSLIKITLITFFMAVILKLIIGTSFKESIITVFYTQIINLIPEIFFSLILVCILKFEINVENYPKILTLLADLFVSVFSIIIAKLGFVNKIFTLFLSTVKHISAKNILTLVLPILLIFNSYLATIYYDVDMVYLIILNNSTIFIVLIIIFILVKKENEYIKIYTKYNKTLTSLKEYEDILDKYRMLNHENKNQLLTIRNMLSKSNKKAINYIDTIIESKINDSDSILKKVSVIPAGGLRGLIYSKLLLIQEYNIQYELNISKEVKTFKLINKLEDSDILDICQVIGVYIDNAIEEIRCNNIDNGSIALHIYLEDKKLVVSISNDYKERIEIDKIEEKGYSTKGDGRGFGLSLAKEIIEKNKKLQNEKKINKFIFTQTLKIKI